MFPTDHQNFLNISNLAKKHSNANSWVNTYIKMAKIWRREQQDITLTPPQGQPFVLFTTIFQVRCGYQARVVCQFTANSPAANSTGWSCLPIRFKREIFTLFKRTSKRTVTFVLNKVFQTRSAVLNDEYLLRDIAIVEYLILVSYKVCYGITFNAAYYLSLP